MKRFFDEKEFDTETGTTIAEWKNGLPVNDYYYVSEILYHTPNGDYFIVGSGGPLTKYAFALDGIKGYGSDIFPLSEADAYEWLKIRGFTDAIEVHFSNVTENA